MGRDEEPLGDIGYGAHGYEQGAGLLPAERPRAESSAHDGERHTEASWGWGSQASDIGTEGVAGTGKKIRQRGAGTLKGVNRAEWVN